MAVTGALAPCKKNELSQRLLAQHSLVIKTDLNRRQCLGALMHVSGLTVVMRADCAGVGHRMWKETNTTDGCVLEAYLNVLI